MYVLFVCVRDLDLRRKVAYDTKQVKNRYTHSFYFPSCLFLLPSSLIVYFSFLFPAIICALFPEPVSLLRLVLFRAANITFTIKKIWLKICFAKRNGKRYLIFLFLSLSLANVNAFSLSLSISHTHTHTHTHTPQNNKIDSSLILFEACYAYHSLNHNRPLHIFLHQPTHQGHPCLSLLFLLTACQCIIFLILTLNHNRSQPTYLPTYLYQLKVYDYGLGTHRHTHC